ncbi:MAG: glycosyltransferase [Gordonia sp. (in: high G+C Gram-positive bacteria)]|uniref:glycosyltransferase family 2 protein n=1 Tax=Gordonia sp. (in: high G+C Gram-positive bacteria) TaxID=84139 RepID=UPI0039E5E170
MTSVTSVIGVIAAFEPGPELVEVVTKAAPQAASLIVVDDGSPSLRTDPSGAVRRVLDRCADLGATVLENPVNSGIAHTLNRGVELALDRGADAVLTLDQDTHLEDGYLARCVEHLALAESLGLTEVMVSPAFINDDVAPFWFAEKGLTLAFEPIQSGLVITRALLERVGLFEEELFIDCVESEFYLRARAHGGHALIVPGTRIAHSLGEPVHWTPPAPLRKLLRGHGSGLRFTEHAPFRHYYITRNRRELYRRYRSTERIWWAVSIAKDTIARGRGMTFGSRRAACLAMTAAGWRAAGRGETGKIPERTLRRAGLGGTPKRSERPLEADRGLPELVSVVIPVHNGVHEIDEQLDALAAQDYPRPFEVLVADNNSTDGLREHLDGHRLTERLRLRWVDASGPAGASYARNVGAAAASGDFLAFCDGDDRVYPRWLTELTAVARRCSAVGGAVETHSLNSARAQSWRHMLPPEVPYEFPGFMRVWLTCNLGVWKDRFDDVGGFDLAYDRGAEDSDFTIRIQLAGGVLGHAPEALVAYRLRDTHAGIWGQSVMCGEGDVRLYSDYRHYGLPRRPWYVSADVVAYLLLRNPLLPTAITRVPTGRWLFQAGNLWGRIKGSARHRCWYV